MSTTVKWAGAKQRAIRERGHCCEVCGYTLVLECDHIKPRPYGGLDVLNNAVLLCPNCHHLENRVWPQFKAPAQSPMPQSRGELIEGIRQYIQAMTDPTGYRLDNPAEDLTSYD